MLLLPSLLRAAHRSTPRQQRPAVIMRLTGISSVVCGSGARASAPLAPPHCCASRQPPHCLVQPRAASSARLPACAAPHQSLQHVPVSRSRRLCTTATAAAAPEAEAAATVEEAEAPSAAAEEQEPAAADSAALTSGLALAWADFLGQLWDRGLFTDANAADRAGATGSRRDTKKALQALGRARPDIWLVLPADALAALAALQPPASVTERKTVSALKRVRGAAAAAASGAQLAFHMQASTQDVLRVLWAVCSELDDEAAGDAGSAAVRRLLQCVLKAQQAEPDPELLAKAAAAGSATPDQAAYNKHQASLTQAGAGAGAAARPERPARQRDQQQREQRERGPRAEPPGGGEPRLAPIPVTAAEPGAAHRQRLLRNAPYVQLRAGDWFCGQCGTHNFGYKKACFHCSVPQQPGSLGGSAVSAMDVRQLQQVGLWGVPYEARHAAHEFAAALAAAAEPQPQLSLPRLADSLGLGRFSAPAGSGASGSGGGGRSAGQPQQQRGGDADSGADSAAAEARGRRVRGTGARPAPRAAALAEQPTDDEWSGAEEEQQQRQPARGADARPGPEGSRPAGGPREGRSWRDERPPRGSSSSSRREEDGAPPRGGRENSWRDERPPRSSSSRRDNFGAPARSGRDGRRDERPPRSSSSSSSSSRREEARPGAKAPRSGPADAGAFRAAFRDALSGLGQGPEGAPRPADAAARRRALFGGDGSEAAAASDGQQPRVRRTQAPAEAGEAAAAAADAEPQELAWCMRGRRTSARRAAAGSGASAAGGPRGAGAEAADDLSGWAPEFGEEYASSRGGSDRQDRGGSDEAAAGSSGSEAGGRGRRGSSGRGGGAGRGGSGKPSWTTIFES